MKFNETNHMIADYPAMEDSRDDLDCFGEFSKEDKVCTTYCSCSICCAIEQSQNPRFDVLDHILTMDFYPIRTH